MALEAIEALVRGGRGDEAIAACRAQLTNRPALHAVREVLAELLALKLDFAGARAEAVELARQRGTAADHLRAGSYAVAAGDAEGAEASFRASIAADGSHWAAHYNLAELYAACGLADEAGRAYQAAVERAGSSYQPWNGLGLSLLQAGKPEQAGRCFTKALQLAPERPEPALNLALVFATLRMKQAARAFADLARRRSVKGAPPHDEASRLLAALA